MYLLTLRNIWNIGAWTSVHSIISTLSKIKSLIELQYRNIYYKILDFVPINVQYVDQYKYWDWKQMTRPYTILPYNSLLDLDFAFS